MRLLGLNLFLSFIMLGCGGSSDPEVDPLQISYEVTEESYFESGDGAIDISVSGGSAPYSFNWSNGSTTEDLFNIVSGQYSCTVRDANGQSERIEATLIEPAEGRVTDIDGNVYKTVRIGSQWWMAENLRAVHDANGNVISSSCYDDNETNANILGRLYTFNETMNGSLEPGAQGIAPEGWHIPTDAEWAELFDYLGGLSTAGGKMKSTDTTWDAPNTGATNSSGFTAVAAGEKEGEVYQFLGRIAIFWSSNAAGAGQANYYYLEHNTERVNPLTWSKSLGLSVRCIRD